MLQVRLRGVPRRYHSLKPPSSFGQWMEWGSLPPCFVELKTRKSNGKRKWWQTWKSKLEIEIAKSTYRKIGEISLFYSKSNIASWSQNQVTVFLGVFTHTHTHICYGAENTTRSLPERHCVIITALSYLILNTVLGNRHNLIALKHKSTRPQK